jgi:HD-GYP domain-containing protein (c-di-GMP phosphodiesterase class II)
VEIPVRPESFFWQLIQQDTPQIISDPDKIAKMVFEPFRMVLLSSVDQAGAEEKLSSAPHWLEMGSVITIPLKLKGRTVGLISLIGAETFPEEVGRRFGAIAEQVSGIIERTRAEQERQRNLQELQLINETFVEGTRLDDTDQISQLLADKIHQANPGSYVMISLYDPEYEAIRVRAITGVGKMIARVADLLGKHPTEILININQHQLDPDLEELFTSGRINEVPEGLYSLTRGVIPRPICRTVERVLGIDRTYIAGLSLGKKSSGGITVFVKEGQEIRYPAAIETIANHFAAVFERRQIREEIEQRTTQLEALRAVEMDIVRELNLDDLLVSIAEKAASMINANDSGFSIYNPDVDALEFQAFTGKEDVLPENTTLKKAEGLAGKVWEKEETIIVDHYASWEGRSEEWAQTSGDYSVIGVPVRWGHEFLGVLELALEPGRQFTQREIDSLELFANQAAIAIQNARLFTGEHHRRQEAETLREVGMIINSMMDRSQVLNSILEQLHRVLPFDSASIQLIDGESIVVEAVAGCLDPKAVLGRRFLVSEDRLVKSILDHGQAQVVDDVRESEDWIEFGDTLYVRSWIGMPLQFRGEIIGLMTLDHHRVGQYSSGDAQLAMNFANQAAIAIENARLLEKAQKQQREAETLRDVGMLINKSMDRSSVMNMILDQLQYVLEYSNATIQLLHDDHLVIEAVRGADSSKELLGASIRVGEHKIIRSMLMDVEAVVIEDLQQIKEWLHYPGSENIHAWLGVPLEIQNQRIGILTVDHQQIGRYDEHDAELVSAFAAQAAIALENSRLFEEAQRRMYRIESLREIDQAISGSLDLQTTLDVLIGQLINTLEVDAAAVLLFKPGLQTLDYVSGRGFRTDFLQYTSLQIGEGLAGRAALQRKMIHVPDLSAQETSLQNSPRLEQESFVTYLAEPLIAKGEIVGVLEVFHRSLLKPDHEWIDFLDALASQAAIAIDRLNLYNDLERSNVELIQAYDATIEGWAKAVELRDGETEVHSRRVVQMTLQLARRLGITGERLADIRRGALLHDIGKMAVPDSILLKPGELSEEDWKVMKKHPVLAYEMLSGIEYLRRALDIPYCHHERWDGSGYPRGVSGEEIPLSARIFAVVDVWDALLSDRPYRTAWSEEKALAYIKDQSGKHFDPDVVKEFFQLIERR